MDETISAPSTDRRVLDHAANEPESPKRERTSYDRELERVTQARTYFNDHDPVNAAIRQNPTSAVFVAAGVGFVLALMTK
jgi:ElaB/YqjD/DUF883 family membrane-anchored ribosome-binding protein